MLKSNQMSLLVVASAIVFSITFSFLVLPSFSALPLSDISEKMKSSSGLTTIKIDGESTATLPQDQATITLNVVTTPQGLNSIEQEREDQLNKLTTTLSDIVGSENISFSTGTVYYNPQGYGGKPDMSSVTTHIELPLKVNVDDVDEVSKIISDQGFWINNIQILKVEKTNDDIKVKSQRAIITSGSSIPGCEIANECYLPSNKVVNSGETVTWTNNDSAAHTVTSGTPENGPDGFFDSGLIAPDATFKYTFDSAGKFDYFCMVHPWMVGTVTVMSAPKDESLQEKQPEYIYQASLTAMTDLPPDSIENSITKYQEKQDSFYTALSKYQIDQQSSRQGNVYFNPINWGQGVSSSFTAQSQIIINVKTQDVEKVLKAAQDSKANMENFFLTYSKETLDKTRQDLTQKAINNARDRAMEIAGPMGLEIKGIKSIEVNSAPLPNPYGNGPFPRDGILLRSLYESNQASEILVSVTVDFEVGKP